MNERTQALIRDLHFSGINALEISGAAWQDFGFKSYTKVQFPEFDICTQKYPKKFDLIIAEQVLEHVLWPYRAVSNIYEMLEPGGYFLVSVPFLIKIHNAPTDCTRWSEMGLRYFLAECGFPIDLIQTDSWGNRQCVVENFVDWVPYQEKIHSLKNEPDFPYHVWALARKSLSNARSGQFGERH